ncbi:MAG: sulfotransferase [Planctomycetota bacterium]
MSRRGPSFFIVGAAKCGTTALQDYLSQWPEVFMPEGKEFHHFADDLLRPDDPLLQRDHYLALFADARPEQLIGEASAFHMLSAVAAERIADHEPDARIVVMLRNPVDVVPALHAQLVFNGEEPLTDLAAALDAEADRRRGIGVPARARFGRKLCYLEVVDFAPQLERFLTRFPDACIVLYDDFARDTGGSVKGIARFLGIDPDFEPDLRVVNANRQVRNRRLQEFVLEPPKGLVRVGSLLVPRPLRRAVRSLLQRANTKERRRPPLPSALRTRITEACAPGIERLAALLGRDLSPWLTGSPLAPQGAVIDDRGQA